MAKRKLRGQSWNNKSKTRVNPRKQKKGFEVQSLNLKVSISERNNTRNTRSQSKTLQNFHNRKPKPKKAISDNNIFPTHRYITRSRSLQNSIHQTRYDSITDYYVKLQAQISKDDLPEVDAKVADSSSLFKEIGCHFPRTNVQQQDETIRFLERSEIFDIPENADNCSLFCKHLERQLSSVSLKSRKSKCITRVKALANHIDAVLEGKENLLLTSPKSPKTKVPMQQYKLSPVSCIIPWSKWNYATPEHQKIKRANVRNRTELNPCILQTNNRGSKILFNLDTKTTTLFKNNFDASDGFGFNNLPAPACSKLPLNHTPLPFGIADGIPLRSSDSFFQFSQGFTDASAISQYFSADQQQPTTTCADCQTMGNLWCLHNYGSYKYSLPCTIMAQSSEFPELHANSEPGCYIESKEFQKDEVFKMDETSLLPSKPESTKISPLKMYPKIF